MAICWGRYIVKMMTLAEPRPRVTDSKFAYELDVPTRYRDLDIMGWVHNSVLLVYVEEARMGYFHDVVDVPPDEMDGAIARQEIDYMKAVESFDAVTVRHRVTEIGNSSLTTRFEVKSDGQIAASGDVTFIVLDESREPRTVPERWRRKIQEFEQIMVKTN